jgi:ribonuclease PH
MRPSRRAPDELRPVSIERNVARYAEGSCLIKFGETHVLCTASLEEKPPSWLRGTGKGWVTAEYAMLPRATHERTRRESTSGKPSGRTQEIQITIDCDVLQADGGTRTASITGGFVALQECVKWMMERKMLTVSPIKDHVAAISCGISKGNAVLDLDYAEDSEAMTDANFVMTGSGGLVEIQGTAEGAPFSQDQFLEMLALARKGIGELVELQKQAVA